MQSIETDSGYSWFRLVLTLLVATIANAGMWAIIVIMPAVEAEFGTTRAEASLPYTLTMIGFALGNYYLGRAVDRFGVSLSLIVAAMTVVLGLILAVLSHSIVLLSAAQLIIGFASAIGFGPLIADISHWFVRRRGIAVALVASGNYLSGAIWPMLLAGVLQDSGWRAVYQVMAVATLIGVIPLALALRRQVSEAAHEAAQLASSLNAQSSGLSPRALQYLLGLAGIGCCVAMSMPQVHIVSYCVDLGFGPVVGAEMLSLMLLGGVGSRVVSGLLADRLGGVRTLLIGSTLQCLALFLYLPAGGLVSLYVVSLVFGLSQGGIVPSYALIVREYMPAREAGARVGFVMMATIMGMALGGWLSGQIYDLSGSYHLAFINGILWNGLNIAIMLWLLLRSKPRAPRGAVTA
ncbi:MFS transporter [Sulfitobacter mediterraneus]|jgi:MFS family permease|uniref:MFS transporter n=1 Tax=Sulfitobacter mediterraneus TaxID=83219 RepID=UPI001933A114|nr:MFS transporter [Sulfitobacter mediterraneus]MBM1632801.1 MFS transporter [Sulfitobacter mediterraneus]MBM1641065.1 MFS transporter [Sulfitobacter mediterraneus]MBM1644666.1 MFS transporter [Sulfitobacter mediterraneus]MBM1649185.1 MFS transporter [Sulfitobacter mediterraneus]MBM1653206.1 MFS transporter [Sulfitobacter mediterraneus]